MLDYQGAFESIKGNLKFEFISTPIDVIRIILSRGYNFLRVVRTSFFDYIDYVVIALIIFIIISSLIKLIDSNRSKQELSKSLIKMLVKIVIVFALLGQFGTINNKDNYKIITRDAFTQSHYMPSVNEDSELPELLRFGYIKEALPTSSPDVYGAWGFLELGNIESNFDVVGFEDSKNRYSLDKELDYNFKESFENGISDTIPYDGQTYDVEDFFSDNTIPKEDKLDTLQIAISRWFNGLLTYNTDGATCLEFNERACYQDGLRNNVKLYGINSINNNISQSSYNIVRASNDVFWLKMTVQKQGKRTTIKFYIMPNLLYQELDERKDKIVQDLQNVEMGSQTLGDLMGLNDNDIKDMLNQTLKLGQNYDSVEERYKNSFEGVLTFGNKRPIKDFLISLNWAQGYLNAKQVESNGSLSRVYELYNGTEEIEYYTLPGLYNTIKQSELGGNDKNLIGLNYLNGPNVAGLQGLDDGSQNQNLPITIKENSLYFQWYPNSWLKRSGSGGFWKMILSLVLFVFTSVLTIFGRFFFIFVAHMFLSSND